MSEPKLCAVVAMDKNRLIGRNNQLPWHLSADLQYFKRVTMTKPVIMGRKTWDSIGKPLPGRDNIVISHDQQFSAAGIHVVSGIDQAINTAKVLNPAAEEVMIIGGMTIYEQLMSKIDRLYLTLIDAKFVGDAWFPEWSANSWQEIQRETHIGDLKQDAEMMSVTYHFVTLDRCAE